MVLCPALELFRAYANIHKSHLQDLQERKRTVAGPSGEDRSCQEKLRPEMYDIIRPIWLRGSGPKGIQESLSVDQRGQAAGDRGDPPEIVATDLGLV